MRRYVIIGSGAAGIAAAEAIRAKDPGSHILMVSEDPFGYYSRPGLAYYLTGEVPENLLYPFRQEELKQRLNLQFLKAHVSRIDLSAHRLHLDQDASSLAYDRLLIATGSMASRPEFPGANLEGVVKLDNLTDARMILNLARKTRQAVVIGGGITALELVEGLVARRVKVHYFLRGDRYWSNVLDETESRIVENRLAEHDVKIHFNTEAVEILGSRGRVTGVRTNQGQVITCGLVAVAIGVRPNASLPRSSGLSVDRGVIVDEFLHTQTVNGEYQPDVFAAGDVAQVYDLLTGKHLVETLWGPARDQGSVAGVNMTGLTVPYCKPVPFNVTRLAGLTTTIIGTVGNGKDADLAGIARGDSETWRQLPDAIAAQSNFDINRVRILIGQKTFLGAIVMGDQTLSKPLQRLIIDRADITPIRDRLLVPGAPLGDLVVDFWSFWVDSSKARTQPSLRRT